MLSPLSNVHRLIAAVLMAMFAIFALWAIFGTMDIVVSAQGKLVPSTFVKVGQPVEAGPVTEVLVKDGQTVKEGELLLRMDANTASKDSEALTHERDLYKAKLLAISTALAGGPISLAARPALPRTTAPPSVGEVDNEFALRLIAQQQAILGAKAALSKAEGDLAATQHTVMKQKRLLELATAAENAHGSLKAQGFISEIAYQDKLKDRIEREQDLQSFQATARANRASVLQATSSVSQVEAEYRKQLAQERTQITAQLHRTEAELAKALHRTALTEVRAPVAGTVNSLAVKSAGQVVSAGAALLTIVPAGEPLIAEVWVRNEDAGFVFPGALAKVKLAAFPFQKYGWVNGEVTWVGADSEVPDSMRNLQGDPLFYKARVALQSQELVRNGKAFIAKPGMQAQVDVLLGERSLLEYLTSPLKRVVLEAGRER